ncbi:MAG: AAA family ATPase [bacterium JZ-2024 1]
MLTKLTIKSFKLFEKIEIELGDRVVFIGPNNSGKTSALQAIALWDVGVKRWLEKRGGDPAPEKRPGVTINRQDLISIPVPAANLLWRNLHVRESERVGGKIQTRNVRVEIGVEGMDGGKEWRCAMEFDYANEESIYCRPPLESPNKRMEIPAHLKTLQVAYLPPMSGLAAREDRLEMGSIRVRLGEGRTAEVLRNLCWQVLQDKDGEKKWENITDLIERFFGSRLNKPQYIAERGEITMSYRTRSGVELDISAMGRGEQQALLLLAHMAVNAGAVLLLDEPDAHLEILRQRQIYDMLAKQAESTNSQLIAASHSEVILNEAAERDLVIAFVGQPHILSRQSQVLKALSTIGYDQYYQAEETGWVLYLEGSTDLAILRALARRLNHPAQEVLERPFVHYVGNQPRKAQEHFYALREAKPDLIGIAIYDRLQMPLLDDPILRQHMWSRRELENYICQPQTLLAFAEHLGRKQQGDLFSEEWRRKMENAITEVERALETLGKNPWSKDIKASEEFLEPVFNRFYESLGLPNYMKKTNYHVLADFVPANEIDQEIGQVLDAIIEVARNANHPEVMDG